MANKIDYSKRYWVIGYYSHPAGGLNDVLCTFDTTEEMYNYTENNEDAQGYIEDGECYFFDKETGIKLDAQL